MSFFSEEAQRYLENSERWPEENMSNVHEHIRPHFIKTSKYTTHDPKQRKITEALVSFIAGYLTPLSDVENPEFKFLIELLNPRYQLPSRKHFSTKLLLERSTSIQNSLKSKLRAVECLFDYWPLVFIGITGHFILGWCMESIMVSCKRFRGQHCAENIRRQEYEEAVACYNIIIADKITCNVTNMAKAFQVTLPEFTCDKDTSLKETHESASDDEDEVLVWSIWYLITLLKIFQSMVDVLHKLYNGWWKMGWRKWAPILKNRHCEGSKLSQICQEIYKCQWNFGRGKKTAR